MLIDGLAIAKSMRLAIKKQVAELGFRPSLVDIYIPGAGSDSATPRYLKSKETAGVKMGFEFRVETLDERSSIESIEKRIVQLNEQVNGLFLQLPVATRLQPYVSRMIEKITPAKDVDGLTSTNRKRVIEQSSDAFYPTPVGAVLQTLANCFDDTRDVPPQFVSGELPNFISRELRGRFATIVSNSDEFGEVIEAVLRHGGVNTSRKRHDSPDVTLTLQQSDVVITAVGKAGFSIGAQDIKEGSILIDVATREQDGKLVGDLDLLSVTPKAAFVTPVPGGIGPVTVAYLYANLLYLVKRVQQKSV